MAGRLNKRTIAYLCALGALAAYYMVWPVWRAQYPLEIWFTESWNAYHQDAAAAGLQLYPDADQLVVNNYPPLSFYAIGWLGRLFGDNLFVGRAISIVGLVAIAVEIALAVRLLAGSLIAGSLGALWFIAIMAHNATPYVGANDPQIAALAIMGAGLVWFLARDRAGQAPEPALLLMVLAGFWKHNIIGIPLTAVSWIIAKGWRPALRPLLVSGAAAVAGLSACVAIFGLAFLDNLLTPRAYRWGHFVSQVGHLQWVALALLIWAAWAWSDRASRAARFTALQIGCGLFACLLQWFGDGVYGNAEFDLIIAVAIGLGVAIARIETSWLARRIGSGPARDVVIILLIIRLVSSGRQESAQVLFDPAFRASLAAATQRQADLAARVAAMPGLVMCRNANLVCRQAGKAFAVDDFKTDQLLATGAFTAPELGQMLRDRKITIFTDGLTSPFALPQASPADPQKANAVSK
jgi:hypothetical protein